MSIREDLRKFHHYVDMLDFLCEHKLETSESLAAKRIENRNVFTQIKRIFEMIGFVPSSLMLLVLSA